MRTTTTTTFKVATMRYVTTRTVSDWLDDGTFTTTTTRTVTRKEIRKPETTTTRLANGEILNY